MNLNLLVLKDLYAICRLDKTASVPEWIYKSDFYSITRAREELSVVCNQKIIESNEKFLIDMDWQCIKIDSLLDLSLTGIIADISGSLKASRIPIFVISTYNTDYFLVKKQNLDKAIECLRIKGHQITSES
jgi:uncharacterized protein